MTDNTDTTDSADSGADMKAMQAQLAEMQKSFDALKAKNDELLGETKAAKAARREAEEKARLESEAAAKKSGDVESLEKSWQQKLSARESELQASIDQLTGHVQGLTVGQTASRIASELAVPGSARVLEPHIRSRLGFDLRDGKPTVVVLDKDGKPSAATVEELAKEVAADAAFAPLIIASQASGGGASGSGKGGGAAKSVTRAAFDGMNPADRMAHVKAGGAITD